MQLDLSESTIATIGLATLFEVRKCCLLFVVRHRLLGGIYTKTMHMCL